MCVNTSDISERMGRSTQGTGTGAMHSSCQFFPQLLCRDRCCGNRSLQIKMLTVKPVKWFINANSWSCIYDFPSWYTSSSILTSVKEVWVFCLHFVSLVVSSLVTTIMDGLSWFMLCDAGNFGVTRSQVKVIEMSKTHFLPITLEQIDRDV